MKKRTLVISGAAIASAAAVAVGGSAIASAGSAPAPAGEYGFAAPGYGGDRGPGRGHGFRGDRAGEGLSGETAVRVVEAAVAKEPTATLLRVGKAEDATYRVAMRRTDGTRVLLTLDAQYRVTATQEHAPRAQGTQRPTSTPTAAPTS